MCTLTIKALNLESVLLLYYSLYIYPPVVADKNINKYRYKLSTSYSLFKSSDIEDNLSEFPNVSVLLKEQAAAG